MISHICFRKKKLIFAHDFSVWNKLTERKTEKKQQLHYCRNNSNILYTSKVPCFATEHNRPDDQHVTEIKIENAKILKLSVCYMGHTQLIRCKKLTVPKY